MATREKTICYSFPMTTTLVADAVMTNLSQITIYVPEANPTFTSVFAEVGFQDAVTATGGTITEHRVGLRLGIASYATITELDDIAHSGEGLAGVIGPIDFTSHFNNNWEIEGAGGSATCDLQVYFDQSTGTTLGMSNVTAIIYITYTYDDTAATQIKTVRIPMEHVNALPTTETQIGTNQIPQLTGVGGFLPEAGVVIRDWFIVAEANETVNNATTDWTLSFRTDTDTTYVCQTQESALGTDRYCRWVYKPTSVPSPTAAHQWKAWSSVSNRAPNICFTLYVTYEFTLAGTSRVLNSLLLPVEIGSPLASTTSALASRFHRTLLIAEPGTINLQQSAFRINYNQTGSTGTFYWRAGAQSYGTYNSVIANTVAGMFCIQKRIDSSSAGGSGVSLARGINTMIIDGYSSSASVDMTNVTGYIILNYESDLSSSGIGAHNHTVLKSIFSWDAAATDLTVLSSRSMPIPETNYYLTSAGFMMTIWQSGSSNSLNLDAQCLSGEGKGGGYYDIYGDAFQGDAERGCTQTWARGRDVFKRFPNDADPERLDIETARNYRMYTSATTSCGVMTMLTYQSMTWTIAGTISGHNASLPSEVSLINADSGELRQKTTLAAGVTAFSFTVNDNTEDYYVSVYQDGTHVGRSAIGQAS